MPLVSSTICRDPMTSLLRRPLLDLASRKLLLHLVTTVEAATNSAAHFAPTMVLRDSLPENSLQCVLNLQLFEAGIPVADACSKAIAQRVCSHDAAISAYMLQQVCIAMWLIKCGVCFDAWYFTLHLVALFITLLVLSLILCFVLPSFLSSFVGFTPVVYHDGGQYVEQPLDNGRFRCAAPAAQHQRRSASTAHPHRAACGLGISQCGH
jgi:hypothetical protein